MLRPQFHCDGHTHWFERKGEISQALLASKAGLPRGGGGRTVKINLCNRLGPQGSPYICKLRVRYIWASCFLNKENLKLQTWTFHLLPYGITNTHCRTQKLVHFSWVPANTSRGVHPATAQVHALAQRRESDNLPLADCSASGSDAQHEAFLYGPLL